MESPCIKVCQIDPRTRLCLGCARTLEEIATWSRLGAEARQAVLRDLPRRRQQSKGA